MNIKTTIVILIIGVFIGTCISKENIPDKIVNNTKKVEVIPNGYVSGDKLKSEKEKSYQEGKTDGYNVGFSEGYKKCEEELTITIDKRRAESEKSNKNQVLFDVKR